MRDKIEYLIVLIFIKLVKVIPEKLTYTIMAFFANVLYLTLKSRRELAIENLTLAFHEKSKEEIIALAKDNFLSISKTIAEILLIISKKKKIESFLEDEKTSYEEYIAGTKDKKDDQGIVFIAAHFGNWEIMANYFASKGFPMTVVGRRGNNEIIEDKITTPFREFYGNTNVHKSEAMSAMVKTLRKGGRIGIMIDQKAGTSGAKTTFFGRECTTTTSIATMKLKYDPLIIPGFSIRDKNGKIKFIILEPVEYKAEEKESKEEKIVAMTQRYNDIFEKVVREYPEQWFWMHNRWKI